MSRAPGRDLARWGARLATALTVLVVIGITLWQLHLNLLLSDTTTTGGDTGAHYMMPAYFSSNLFPHLTGWDPAWYAGYPIYTFYFVLPDVLVAIASHVISYNVAFKLATALGSVLLPIAAWAMGRLFRLRPPLPAALAAATLPFLFDYTWTIYGGNLFSTLAGEYSYSLSLALALVFLGLFADGLRTGRHRASAAVVLALCVLSHIVGFLFALVGAALLTLVELLPASFALHDDAETRHDEGARQEDAALSQDDAHVWHDLLSVRRDVPARQDDAWDVWHVTGLRKERRGDRHENRRVRALWWSASTVGIGVLLSCWWLIPFLVRQPYSTAMGYQNLHDYGALLLPVADWWALVLAALGSVVALVQRSRFGLVLSALGGLSALGLAADPQGSLYNVRLLPLWFLCVYLLAGWLFGTAVWGLARFLRSPRLADVAGPVLALAGACLVVVPPLVAPTDLPFGIHAGANQVSNWSAWNYTGYETSTGPEAKDYPEYHGLMQTMLDVGRRDGCGRAMWEYNANQNRFGTPEALMLLPYWTGGCIDSMEGLLFESSTTTPFHFINQAELSVAPSEPMVGLPYGSLDIPLGIRHLQLLGVRYFMAFSPSVVQAADRDPLLRQVAESGPWRWDYEGQELDTLWHIYVIHGATPVVTALPDEPAVLTGVSPAQSSWLFGGPVKIGPALSFYVDPVRWNVELTAGGPSRWPRVAARDTDPPVVRAPPVTISHVRQSASSVSFHVSRVGTPVLVKISYFPNWQASGAEGPWRATPNLMVVVPTSHDVTLSYGSTHANDIGILATLLGLALVAVVLLAQAGRLPPGRNGRRPLARGAGQRLPYLRNR